MSTFLVFAAGMLFFAGIIYIMLPRAKSGKTWLTVLNWVLYVVFFFDFCVGVSFVYLNSGFGHVKATSAATFLFIGSSIVIGLVLARLLGLLGFKSKAKEVSLSE